MDINYYKQYEPLFGAWYIKELIGGQLWSGLQNRKK